MRKPFIIFVFKGLQVGINDNDKAAPERQGELTLKNIVYSNIVYCKKSLREQNTEFYKSFAMHMF